MCHLDLNVHHLLTPKGEMFWSLLTIFILRKPQIFHSNFLNAYDLFSRSKGVGWESPAGLANRPLSLFDHLTNITCFHLSSTCKSTCRIQLRNTESKFNLSTVKKEIKCLKRGPLQPAPLAGQEASITCTAGQGTGRP